MDYMDELLAQLRCDPNYQACLDKLKDMDADFEMLRSSLSSNSQDLLDRYISVCEEMDDIMCAYAYRLGFAHGQRQ